MSSFFIKQLSIIALCMIYRREKCCQHPSTDRSKKHLRPLQSQRLNAWHLQTCVYKSKLPDGVGLVLLITTLAKRRSSQIAPPCKMNFSRAMSSELHLNWMLSQTCARSHVAYYPFALWSVPLSRLKLQWSVSQETPGSVGMFGHLQGTVGMGLQDAEAVPQSSPALRKVFLEKKSQAL